MQCVNCSAVINPEWVHAISNNTCPSCGKNIMEDNNFELLSELKTAILSMAEKNIDVLAEGLAGWLVSNYHMRKIVDNVEPTEFHSTKNGKANRDIKIRETNQFFKNNNIVPKTMKDVKDKYSNLIEAINSGLDNDVDLESDGPPLSENELEDLKSMEMESLPPALHMDKLARLQKQKDLQTGTYREVNGMKSLRRSDD
jgi:hypothetical protein